MRIHLQRVKHASVAVAGKTIAQIDQGLLLLVGFGVDDETTPPDQAKMIQKVLNLRIFPNDQGKLDHSVLDIDGGVLVVPQFTLYGNCNKGRRPDFSSAAQPKFARLAFQAFCDELFTVFDKPAQCGEFAANMAVSLINDGPITLLLDTDKA